MAQTIDMSGKAALVTGAASGLGRATALRLAEAGAMLTLVDVDTAALEETVRMVPGIVEVRAAIRWSIDDRDMRPAERDAVFPFGLK